MFTNAEVQTVLGEALTIVETAIASTATNKDGVVAAKLNLLHSSLFLTKTFSASSNGIPALRGLGLDEAISLSRQIVASGKITSSMLSFNYKNFATGIVFNSPTN